MSMCNENYERCSCSHLKQRIADLERQVSDLLAYNQTRTDELAASVAQVAALTREHRNAVAELHRSFVREEEFKAELKRREERSKPHGFARRQSVQVVWDTFRKEIPALREQLAASQAREKLLRDALGAVGRNNISLQSLAIINKALATPTDDTALQARLKEERERWAAYALAHGCTDMVTKIRSMT